MQNYYIVGEIKMCKQVYSASSQLQIGRGIEDNSKITFLIFNEDICCDPSMRRF